MRMIVSLQLPKPLVLPINYHQILQAIIYSGLSAGSEYSAFVHDEGYLYKKRQFKMFTFGPLEGKYWIRNKQIVFENAVRFEVRSPEILLIQTLAANFQKQGVAFGEDIYREVTVTLFDDEVEETEVLIKMKTPICVYRTEPETKKVHFYKPEEPVFYQLLEDNFMRKYQACYGVTPESAVEVLPVKIGEKDKYVTKYKSAYLSGWKGIYRMKGKRKYINFLYQTGLGSKNSQGFGMFEIISQEL